jgi:hypothetical protein
MPQNDGSEETDSITETQSKKSLKWGVKSIIFVCVFGLQNVKKFNKYPGTGTKNVLALILVE